MSPSMRGTLDIRVRRRGDCSIVECSGRAVLEHGVERLGEVIARELLDDKRVIVDLSGVVQVDAQAIGLLADISRKGLAMGQGVSIIGAEPRIQRLLRLTGLDAFVSGDASADACTATQDTLVSPTFHASV